MAEEQGSLIALDHVNIRTAQVDQLVTFYCGVLGLGQGRRPPFPFGGAWLYCGQRPVVHLVEVPSSALRTSEPEEVGLSHFAFSGSNMEAFLARLQQAAVPYRVAQLPDSNILQVNLRDPDGNALHVDFAASVG
jgi:catechol 2,3-dioxygenase-like lactoylglutathione lyase family enzyme